MSDVLERNESPIKSSLNYLRTDQEMLLVLREKFGELENYQAFEAFIGSPSISKNEQAAFNSVVSEQIEIDDAEELLMDIEFGEVALPTNRETFALFAKKFSIPTSQENDELEAEKFVKTKQNYLNALPVLNEIKGVPQTAKLRTMIGDLQDLEGDALGDAIKAIEGYLV